MNRRDVALDQFEVRVRGILRRVLSLRPRPTHLYVGRLATGNWAMLGDAGGLIHLAELAGVAACDPDSLLFVPRGEAVPVGFEWQPMGPQMDLVLVHHSTQFRRSDWKNARPRLGLSHPTKRQVFIHPEEKCYDPKNPLDLKEAGGTLFVVGSASVFRALAGELWELAGWPHDNLDEISLGYANRKGPTCDYGLRRDLYALTWTRWLPPEPAS